MLPNAAVQAFRSVHPEGSSAHPDFVSGTAGFPHQISGRLPHPGVYEAPDGFFFSTDCSFASRPTTAVCQAAYPVRISPSETASCYAANQVLRRPVPFNRQVALSMRHGTYLITAIFQNFFVPPTSSTPM